MQFARHLHDGIRHGEITTTIRIWQRLQVKVGGQYKLGDGEIVVESIQQITLDDITPELARESGFNGVMDLLKTAKHGNGSNVYFIRFHYQEPGDKTLDDE